MKSCQYHLSEESTRIIRVEMQMNQSWHVSHLGDCIIIYPVTPITTSRHSTGYRYNLLCVLPGVAPPYTSIIFIIAGWFQSIFRSTFTSLSLYLDHRSRHFTSNAEIEFLELQKEEFLHRCYPNRISQRHIRKVMNNISCWPVYKRVFQKWKCPRAN